VGGCGRDVNCSTIMAYDCLSTEKPSNNPVGPTVETEKGLTPRTQLRDGTTRGSCFGSLERQMYIAVVTVIFSGRSVD
jgi:hypothetical protein